ncbi:MULTISPECIES: hypothetical protein [unclassified Ensifer]|uniref:hypothetical protein n=1 Tax=unclassified Ensifer TaxID=2633371 RepID=UPI0008133343|nr:MULTISPECIES: hypothetical protein [unclassified Ensifer]OCP17909.1 hypothetical protein BC361_32635 [Ensifer sp. LC54]OCP17929.1 hypothetical protein BC363_32825 [Ensifer sp. LC384]
MVAALRAGIESAMSLWSMSHEAERDGEMRDTMIGVDLAKRVFHVHEGLDEGACEVPQEADTRAVPAVHSRQRTCVFVFEAYGSAHY